jgi:hypothetical protein
MLNCWTETNAREGNREVLLVASKAVGLVVTACIRFASRQHSVGQNGYTKVAENTL